MIRGSCLCGAVSFEVTGSMRPVVACHCVQCRKTSGHYVAASSAPRGAVQIAGEVTWYRSSPGARRGFCGTCGSSLFWDGSGENLSIHAGTLDDDPGVKLVGHIHAADKGAYYDLDDGLPVFPADDAVMTTRVE